MKRLFSMLIIIVLLSGCVGIGAPILSPYYNAKNADALLAHDRPLPAEMLIEATITRSKKKKDEVGLAMGYGAYAGFLQSPVLERWKEHYIKDRFMDPTVTFENRFEKAKEYWIKAIGLYERNEEYSYISNAYINLATLEYFRFGNKDAACSDLDLSLKYHEKFKENNPEETVILPKGFSDFYEYIAAAKKQLECD